MLDLTRKLGFFACLTALFSFLIYTCCFTVILFVNPPFTWEGIRHFAAYEAGTNPLFKYIGMGCMIVYACAFVVMVLCIREKLDETRKILGTVAAAFALAFCISVCINYYVGLTSTRLQLQAGMLDGLVQFTQSYNLSAINGINMLGWTVFYGISCLALGLAFGGSRAGRVLRAGCLANSAFMLAGLIGYLLNNFSLLLISMNLGLGIAGLFIIIGAIFYFKRDKERPSVSPGNVF